MRQFLMLLLSFAAMAWPAMQVHVESREEMPIGSNSSQVRLLLVNTGTETLENATVYYWFSVEQGKTPEATLYSGLNAQVGTENLGSGNYRLKVILSNIGLQPGASYNYGNGALVSIHTSDWAAWNLADDYSYIGPPQGAYQLNSKIQLVNNQNVVIWGIAPGTSSMSLASSASAPTNVEIFYDGQSFKSAIFEPATAWPDGMELVANHGQYDGYGNIDMYAVRVSGAKAYLDDWTASYKLPAARDFTGATFAFDLLVINDNTVGSYTPRWGFRLQDITGRTSEPIYFNFSFKQAQAIQLPASSFVLPADFNLQYVTHIVMEQPQVPAQQHITVFFDNIRLLNGSTPLSSIAVVSSSSSAPAVSSSQQSSSSQTPASGSLTVQTEGMGYALPSGSIAAPKGSQVSVSLYPNTGFALQRLELDGNSVEVPSNGLFQFAGDGSDHTFLAVFGQSYGNMKLLQVTLGLPKLGWASLVGSHLVPQGSSYTIQFYPYAGNRVKSVILNGANLGPLSQLKVGPIQDATTVHVEFEAVQEAGLELVSHGDGSLKLAESQDELRPWSVIAVPNVGAYLRDLQWNGISQGNKTAIEIPRDQGGRLDGYFEAQPSTGNCPVLIESKHQTPDVFGRPDVRLTGKGSGIPEAGWYWDYYVRLPVGDQLNFQPWNLGNQTYQSERISADLWRIRVTGLVPLAVGQVLTAQWGMQYSTQYPWYKSAELSATPEYDDQWRSNASIPLYSKTGEMLCPNTPSLEHTPSNYLVEVLHKDDGCSQEYMRPRILIRNIGTEPLSDFSYLYIFKITDGRVPQLDGDWYTPEAQVSLLDLEDGEYALRFDFTGTTLHPGQSISTGGATAGVHLLGWESVNHSDDFSFQQSSCGGSMVLNDKIPVYDRDGKQIYGQEFDLDNPNGGVDQVEFLSGPDDITVVQGKDAGFQVQISSTVNFNLQWLRNGKVINGATSNSFTEPKVGMSMDGWQYQVIVWVNGEKKLSRAATLHVTPKNLAPIFDIQPRDLVIRAGMDQPIQFNAHAIDPMGGTVRYQWYANRQAVAGATSEKLELTFVAEAQNGLVVYVVATGIGGSTKSRAVALKVLPFVPPSQRITLTGLLVSKRSPNGVSGKVPMSIRVYAQRKGGVMLYEEHFREVGMQPTAEDGRFSVQLGTGDATTSLASVAKSRETLYAEIRFGAGSTQELAPERIPFTAIPYTQGVAP